MIDNNLLDFTGKVSKYAPLEENCAHLDWGISARTGLPGREVWEPIFMNNAEVEKTYKVLVIFDSTLLSTLYFFDKLTMYRGKLSCLCGKSGGAGHCKYRNEVIVHKVIWWWWWG